MLICELAILLGLRGVHIPSSLKKKDLENMFKNPITNEELNNLKLWNECSKHSYIHYLSDNIYSDYSLQELKSLLEIKLKHTFPVPLSFISCKYKLLSYYYLRGYPLTFTLPSFTEEQQRLLTSFSKSSLPYIIVTNAGPGTGKTTVANERANLLKFEGVLLISYTNAAINTNYDRLHIYSKMKGILGKKDYEKKLNVTTVDSIAGYINRTINDDGHDTSIRSAINRIKHDPEAYNLFAVSGQGLKYNHIIADECQDIDDLRGELILTLHRVLRTNSLVLCGDPRQRVRENHGKWYKDLWAEDINIIEEKISFEKKTVELPSEDEFEKMMNNYIEPSVIDSDDLINEISSISIPEIKESLEEEKNRYILPLINNIHLPQVYTFIESSMNIIRVGFPWSHRFQNPLMLDLVNSLSERRPHIHYPLKAHPNNTMIPNITPICFMGLKKGYDDIQLSKIALYIRDTLHRDNGVPYSEIAFVTPTMARENKISLFTNHIYTVLRSHGIPCYSKIEGSYRPIGIVFSTIHSIKGSEFDYVFALGMNGYPETFTMIPYSEAESLVYVLHSRARKRIFYIGDEESFKIPRGVNPEYIDHTFKTTRLRISNTSEKEPTVLSYIVTDVSKDFSIYKLLSANGFSLGLSPENSSHRGYLQNYLPAIPEGMDSRFWGVMCGMMIEICLTKRYPSICIEFNSKKYTSVKYSNYLSMVHKGEIVYGRHIINNYLVVCENCINTPNKEEMEMLNLILQKPINELKWNDILSLGKIYDYIISNSTQSRYLVKFDKEYNLIPIFMKISDEIMNNFGPCLGTEIHVEGFKIRGCLDALFNDYIIEFKTINRKFEFKDMLQVFLYSILKRKTMADIKKRWPILLNLQTGEYSLVTSDRENISWDYIINAYIQLKIHVDLVTYRKNKLIGYGKFVNIDGVKKHVPFITPTFPQNTFVCDTEFYNNEIFDLAAVNLNDPFRSLICPIKVSDNILPFATKWMSCTRERFDTSKRLSEIQSLFFKIIMLNSTIPVTLMNYVAKMDTSWWPQCISIDMSKKARECGLKNGYFMDGSAPPTLSSLYSHVGSLIETQTHLKIHTALSDSLMLYEMAILDLL